VTWQWTDSVGIVHVTPVCYIDATGVHRPSLDDCLAYLENGYRSIYGSDTYLGSDSQDGEHLGLFAAAYDDMNQFGVSAYNSFSPTTAQGVGLSSNIKLNGMKRKVPSYSTVPALIIGQAFIPITNGLVTDDAGNDWALPVNVTIPASGQVAVTLTCQVLGAITLATNTQLTIKTQTRGWQQALTTNDAAPGDPVEVDGQLRIRQSQSTAGPAAAITDALKGAVLAVAGVTAVEVYDNDTLLPDENGIPGGCISLVVQGGALNDIADAVRLRKAPGVPTYGTTVGLSTDAYGITHKINYFIPTPVAISYSLRLRALSGYTTDVGTQIAAALANWTNALGIGKDVLLNRANVPANLNGVAASMTYEILSLQVGFGSGTVSSSDVTIAFNQIANCPIVQNSDGSFSYPSIKIALT